MTMLGHQTLGSFYDSLQTSMAAGIAPRQALTLAAVHPELRAPVQRMLAALDRGEPLAGIWRSAGCFAPLDIALITAGEQCGQLPATFGRLAADYRRRRSCRRLLYGAMAYPALLLLGAVAAGNAPLLVMLGPAVFLRRCLLIIGVIVAGLALAGWLWGVLMRSVPAWAGLWYSVPFVGDYYRAQARAHFYRLLCQTYTAGMPLRQLGALLADTGDDALRQEENARLTAQLERDLPLAQVLAESRLFPRDECMLLSGAETAGAIGGTAARLADQAESDLQRTSRTLVFVVSGATLGAMAVWIIRMYVTTLTGYFSVIDSLL